jgi:hypothetical protein
VLGFYVITKQVMRTNQKHNKPPSQYLKELFIDWLIDFVSSMDNYFSA